MDIKEYKKKLRDCRSIVDYRKLALDENIVAYLKHDAEKNNPLKDNNTFLMGKRKKAKNKGNDDSQVGEVKKGDYQAKIVTFNLPQEITCPGRTPLCEQFCYEIASEKRMQGKDEDKTPLDSIILVSRKNNLIRTMTESFVPDMVSLILRARTKDKPYVVRIHSSGDFYDKEYLLKWMQIAARVQYAVQNDPKHKGKDYRFVCYTKSLYILQDVMNDYVTLNDLYTDIFGKDYSKDEYTFEDFNLHVIGSIMDDTPDEHKDIIEKYNLPSYVVEKDKKEGQIDCMEQPCAVCMECYPLKKDVHTILR